MMPLLKKKAKSEDKTTATCKSSEESPNRVSGNMSEPKESSIKLCIGKEPSTNIPGSCKAVGKVLVGSATH